MVAIIASAKTRLKICDFASSPLILSSTNPLGIKKPTPTPRMLITERIVVAMILLFQIKKIYI